MLALFWTGCEGWWLLAVQTFFSIPVTRCDKELLLNQALQTGMAHCDRRPGHKQPDDDTMGEGRGARVGQSQHQTDYILSNYKEWNIPNQLQIWCKNISKQWFFVVKAASSTPWCFKPCYIAWTNSKYSVGGRADWLFGGFITQLNELQLKLKGWKLYIWHASIIVTLNHLLMMVWLMWFESSAKEPLNQTSCCQLTHQCFLFFTKVHHCAGW